MNPYLEQYDGWMDGSKRLVSKTEYNHHRDANNSQACKNFMRYLQAINSLGEGAAGGISVGEQNLTFRLDILALV